MDDIKRILVVSRSTKNCRKAVHYGISLAKQYRSKLYVLHVIHDPFSVDGWNLPIPSLKQEYEKLVKKGQSRNRPYNKVRTSRWSRNYRMD